MKCWKAVTFCTTVSCGKSSPSSIIASFEDLLEECEDEAKESIDEFDNGENGSSDPKPKISTD